uniref:Uncharacterized protein n=1 Tax=Romanomermis culicivorax TaxID=13658 RepID=A0A915IXG8_ROMCU
MTTERTGDENWVTTSLKAKSAGISRNRSHSTYWTIHLLKLKRGVISFDCNAVLIPIHTPVSYQSKSANSSLSDILLTSAYCLHQKDARLGKMYVPNATQLSALFVERAPNGKMLNDLELRITNYLIHSKYSRGMPHDTVDVALIKLQTYLPVPKSFAAIPVSHFSLDE